MRSCRRLELGVISSRYAFTVYCVMIYGSLQQMNFAQRRINEGVCWSMLNMIRSNISSTTTKNPSDLEVLKHCATWDFSSMGTILQSHFWIQLTT